MSRETAQLLEAFKALPESEKRVFTAEVWRLSMPFDSGPIEDEEIGLAGRTLFVTLDQEEHDTNTR